MNEKRKREITEARYNLTLEGVRCSIGGWKNDHATLTPDCGGFWGVNWEDAESIILERDGQFTSDNVWFISWVWQGFGVLIPRELAMLGRVPRSQWEELVEKESPTIPA